MRVTGKNESESESENDSESESESESKRYRDLPSTLRINFNVSLSDGPPGTPRPEI